jgi:hypothetical protein
VLLGDPGGDVFVSPGEPVFWLHHGQLDRHWWMWQNYIEKDLKARTSMYEGMDHLSLRPPIDPTDEILIVC